MDREKIHNKHHGCLVIFRKKDQPIETACSICICMLRIRVDLNKPRTLGKRQHSFDALTTSRRKYHIRYSRYICSSCVVAWLAFPTRLLFRLGLLRNLLDQPLSVTTRAWRGTGAQPRAEARGARGRAPGPRRGPFGGVSPAGRVFPATDVTVPTRGCCDM